MQLYVGSAEAFVQDASGPRLADSLRRSFYDYYAHQPSHSELQSWMHSLSAMALQIAAGKLLKAGVVVEMELPLSSSRLDVLLFGQNDDGADRGVVVELKQWSSAVACDVDDVVMTFVGGKQRPMVHPSRQAFSYARYLSDANDAYWGDDAIQLVPCAFLHNMNDANAAAIYDEKFASILSTAPAFTITKHNEFTALLRRSVGRGSGKAVLERALSGKPRPARKLLAHTAGMIKGEDRYTLLDDQIIAYQTVLREVRRANRRDEHSIIVVTGGPGTGKSVIALNLVGRLSQLGCHVVHATGSKSFTETLWKVLGSRAKPQFRYFNNFTTVQEGAIDVLIADEAHRIRKSSNSRFTPAVKRSVLQQTDELIKAARVSVFFLDDFQSVRPDEIGSSHLLRETALRDGHAYRQIDLRTQFRCAGSDTYLDWIDQLLEIRKTGTIELTADEKFQCSLVDRPEDLDAYVRGKLAAGSSARIVAGFCWKWSDPNSDGMLADDIAIGDFRRPWNAKSDKAILAKGIPGSSLWAWDDGGVDQVGCIYTAQGFEFDYVGVIVGPDLVNRNGVWVGNKDASADSSLRRLAPGAFLNHIKNVYRVLLTRGMRGAAFCIMDDETRAFVRSRMRSPAAPSDEGG